MAKNKRLTNKEKQARAELKKRMQDKGVLPPDKPKLNRKKFIDEAREEWNGRSSDCFIWEHYLMDAISYMLCQREGMSSILRHQSMSLHYLLLFPCGSLSVLHQ